MMDGPLPESRTPPPSQAALVHLAAGADRYGERRGLGVSEISFKVCPEESGGILVIENTFHAPGGPARHLHHDQDEWFYAVEGDFIDGSRRGTLASCGPGDRLLAPRRVPHVWAHTGDGRRAASSLPSSRRARWRRSSAR
jgi:uncharacterized RmlC-like cupin family protein